MKNPLHRWIVPVATIIFLLVAVTGTTYNLPAYLELCQGKFKGRKPTPAELNQVLTEHKDWLLAIGHVREASKLQKADPRKANLCGAHLWNADLLKGADLDGTDLSGASLFEANLSGADLDGTDLSGASLLGANLSGAQLLRTNLSGADLDGANLSGAELRGANLSGADLDGANLDGTLFEPRALPDVDRIAYAQELALISYLESPQALMKLRKAFREAGFYGQEREITYAIKHPETMALLSVLLKRLRYDPREQYVHKLTGLSLLLYHVRHWGQLGHWVDVAWFLEGAFSYVFFDLPTLWGMVPGRALLVLLALIPVFTIPYVISLRRPGINGIWRQWSDDRMRTDLGTKRPVRLRVGWCQALALGLYFSVLSAFNIGWRELNVGNWIQRLQANEYTLRATGWVRTVAGVQALVSVYLLAMWALTYFGRPFE